MSFRSLAILAAAGLVLFLGVRSLAGHETSAEHLYGGQMVEITCSDGQATEGPGLHLSSAQQACAEARNSQRGRAPWLLGGGAILLAWGITDFRSGRSR